MSPSHDRPRRRCILDCRRAGDPARPWPAQAEAQTALQTVIFAGGCFWSRRRP